MGERRGYVVQWRVEEQGGAVQATRAAVAVDDRPSVRDVWRFFEDDRWAGLDKARLRDAIVLVEVDLGRACVRVEPEGLNELGEVTYAWGVGLYDAPVESGRGLVSAVLGEIDCEHMAGVLVGHLREIVEGKPEVERDGLFSGPFREVFREESRGKEKLVTAVLAALGGRANLADR